MTANIKDEFISIIGGVVKGSLNSVPIIGPAILGGWEAHQNTMERDILIEKVMRDYATKDVQNKLKKKYLQEQYRNLYGIATQVGIANKLEQDKYIAKKTVEGYAFGVDVANSPTERQTIQTDALKFEINRKKKQLELDYKLSPLKYQEATIDDSDTKDADVDAINRLNNAKNISTLLNSTINIVEKIV